MTQSFSLGDRMKAYENVSRIYLPHRIPVIIRVDGKAFHALTDKYFEKGWSQDFTNIMMAAAIKVQKEIQGCDFCYSQSDEISFLLTDYKTIKTDGWFGYNLQKIISVSAALTSTFVTQIMASRWPKVIAVFDSRAFSVPQDEVANYFLDRQQDATRNAILMAAQEHFSHKQLHGKNCDQMQEMLFQEKGINFNDYPIIRKRGLAIVDGKVDLNIPIFSQDQNYIEKFVNVRED